MSPDVLRELECRRDVDCRRIFAAARVLEPVDMSATEGMERRWWAREGRFSGVLNVIVFQ